MTKRMLWLTERSNDVGDTMAVWTILMMLLMALAVSAVVGLLVSLAFFLIRRSGKLSHR